jgi:hypothetical protein
MSRTSLALLAAGTAWAVHLVLSYFLAWAGCARDDGALLVVRHLATVAAAGVALGAVIQAVRASGSPAAEAYGAHEQAAEHRYVAHLSIVLGLVFLFAIVMTGAASLFLSPCV